MIGSKQSMMRQKSGLAKRCLNLSAGCALDEAAASAMNVDLPTLRKLAEAFKAGWLHNVMARITPLTMRKRGDYVKMADLFVCDETSASYMLERFVNDIEMFCNIAGIEVTEHMTADNVSPELQAHVSLYMEIATLFAKKFEMQVADPIAAMVTQPVMTAEVAAENMFVKKFLEREFQQAS